ncbi:MAG: UDP-N-acetylmuramoyl-L-alanyl-D-glutamate--2,6-diaminopimelate ligase [Spirochaetota bacterium]|jgi:UDP-N-acetylmuramyl-tripeptide synthetase|nr:UDP-N-acetylmuramoyl-L-alanyl-D-glutamate--2,6-diaminopimelate ligase [Spirochaetota bacterium]
MRFVELMGAIAPGYDRDCEISAVTTDSRRVAPGTLFIALKGVKSDGHTFIPQAIEQGAAAIILEDAGFIPAKCAVPCVVCADIRKQLAGLAARFYGNPTRALTVIGVTGTNGKTSTTYYLKAILEAAGIPTGLIGTIEHIIGSEREPAANTTPDGLKLQELFARMRDAGMRAAVMEVSSHGLALGRTEGIEFDGAIFTNITEDHLDFHKTMEEYLAAKLLFADQLERSAKSNTWYCCNRDIQYADTVKARLRKSGLPIWYFGEGDAGADPRGTGAEYILARDAVASLHETSYMLCRRETALARTELASRGYFNIYNSLAAASAALALGIAPDIIARGMAEVRIPGRFELVPNDRGFLVAVDYAHTDDALANLLSSARRLEPGRIITVFGCGGDRDRAKRPKMARAASSLSDMVIVTSDNPRTENPEAIIQDILPGITDTNRARVCVDRASAIRAALREARKGDIVLIAGKGHENYQIFADRTIHFDDREIAAEALAAL